jgi:hypothetical protein
MWQMSRKQKTVFGEAAFVTVTTEEAVTVMTTGERKKNRANETVVFMQKRKRGSSQMDMEIDGAWSEKKESDPKRFSIRRNAARKAKENGQGRQGID